MSVMEILWLRDDRHPSESSLEATPRLSRLMSCCSTGSLPEKSSQCSLDTSHHIILWAGRWMIQMACIDLRAMWKWCRDLSTSEKGLAKSWNRGSAGGNVCCWLSSSMMMIYYSSPQLKQSRSDRWLAMLVSNCFFSMRCWISPLML